MASSRPPVCDYEGSDYEARFWGQGARAYEDQVERVALQRLLPPQGTTLLDVGAGFGRLANEYGGYDRVVLLDYSRSLLRQAQERLGHDRRFLFVAADWYRLPFVTGLFEALVQVRTLHHAADVPALMRELARIGRPGGHYVLEYASKHHLKAMARYLLRRQAWSPWDETPVEFVPLNFDFHPAYIQRQLRTAGFVPLRRRSVSYFRLAWLKRLAPTALLVRVDAWLQPAGQWWPLSPSVFVLSQHRAHQTTAPPDAFFRCPHCGSALHEAPEHLACLDPACHRLWAIRDGLYDFKEPTST